MSRIEGECEVRRVKEPCGNVDIYHDGLLRFRIRRPGRGMACTIACAESGRVLARGLLPYRACRIAIDVCHGQPFAEALSHHALAHFETHRSVASEHKLTRKARSLEAV